MGHEGREGGAEARMSDGHPEGLVGEFEDAREPRVAPGDPRVVPGGAPASHAMESRTDQSTPASAAR